MFQRMWKTKNKVFKVEYFMYFKNGCKSMIYSHSQFWVSSFEFGELETRNLNLCFNCGNARQFFSFQKFQHRAAARRDITHGFRQAHLRHRRDRIAAANE